MPDRLPSLIVLIGFWVPPAALGWAVARSLQRSGRVSASRALVGTLGLAVIAYALAWYYFNSHRMPPYIPGAVDEPTVATPEASRNLAIFTAALIMPGSALACAIAFLHRLRAPQGS